MGALKFYEIAAEYRDVMQAIEDADGELSPHLETVLNFLEGSIADKADSIAALVREKAAEAEAYHAEAERIAAKGAVARRAAEGLKSYLKRHLEAMGLDSVKGARFKVRIQRNGTPSIRFDGDIADLPERFRRVKVEVATDAARDAWKAGDELPRGFVVEQGTHLRIA